MTGAQWCPSCRAEYVVGWGTCSTCGVPLVDSLPPEPLEPRPRLDPSDDDLISIWEGPTPEAERVRTVLEAAHIPVDLDDATNVGEARVVVPRSYLTDARDAVRNSDGSWPDPVDHRDGFDWSPGVKLTLVIVAIVLIVLLLFVS